MRSSLALAALLLLGTSVADANMFSNTVDLPLQTAQIQLSHAEFTLLPTRTETRRIPNCNPNSEAAPTCTEEIVLESEPAIRVHISYIDRMFSDDNGGKRWVSLYFSPSDFSAADVAALEAAYPTWKHPFSNAGRRFAAKNLELVTRKAVREIQVVDVPNSHLCRIGESGEPDPTCRERIVYKPSTTTVREVTVHLRNNP